MFLLASPSSSFTAHPYLHENLPYKPGDLLPIARVSNTLITIAVPASLKVETFADLIAMARAQPGKLNWAGTTGALDFSFAGFLQSNGLNMTKVPYRNPVEAANDLAEGRVQVYEAALAIVRPQLEAGKIKPLIMTNSVRAPTLPDVPTATEAGHPELAFDGLVGYFGFREFAHDPAAPPAGGVLSAIVRIEHQEPHFRYQFTFVVDGKPFDFPYFGRSFDSVRTWYGQLRTIKPGFNS